MRGTHPILGLPYCKLAPAKNLDNCPWRITSILWVLFVLRSFCTAVNADDDVMAVCLKHATFRSHSCSEFLPIRNSNLATGQLTPNDSHLLCRDLTVVGHLEESATTTAEIPIANLYCPVNVIVHRDVMGPLHCPKSTCTCCQNQLTAGVLRQLHYQYPATEIAFVFDLRGYLGFVLNPDPQPHILLWQVSQIAPYSVARVCRAAYLPREFATANLNPDRNFYILLCCDHTIPANLPLAYILSESTGDLTDFRQLRAVSYHDTVVSELALRRPLNLPRFLGNCYMWPWINSWIVPPYETSIVQGGFFVRFCPFDRVGRVLSRDDIMRDRLYVYALTTFPINMAAALTAPAPVRNPESGEEADAEASEDALSPRTAESADTENPTPSCESDVSPVLTISSTTSLHAGAGAENSALHPMRTTQEVPPAQQDVADEECKYKSLTPSCKALKLPIIDATQNKHACLTPHSKFLKKQRASRRRAVLSDDALHTNSTEAFVRKRPHLTRSSAIKAMRSYRLDKWLEQQDRSSSTSSVLSPSPAPSSTVTWTPIPGFPPNSSSPGLRDGHPDPPIRPRALLFEPALLP